VYEFWWNKPINRSTGSKAFLRRKKENESFNPASPRAKSAFVAINNNDADESSYLFIIQGSSCAIAFKKKKGTADC
jgi:hypothetical protein